MSKKITLKGNEEIKIILYQFGFTQTWKYFFGLLFIFAPSFFAFQLIAAGLWGYIALGAGWLIGLLIIFHTWFFSRANQLIVTSERLVDVSRPGFLTEEVSSIGVGDIKDISLRKKGFWENLFNFGRLIVETSSEQVTLEFRHLYKPQNVVAFIMSVSDEYFQNQEVGNKDAVYRSFLKIIPELSDDQLDVVQNLIARQFEEVLVEPGEEEII